MVLLEFYINSGAGHSRLVAIRHGQRSCSLARSGQHGACRAVGRLDALLRLAATGVATGQYDDLPDLVRPGRQDLELQADVSQPVQLRSVAVVRACIIDDIDDKRYQ